MAEYNNAAVIGNFAVRPSGYGQTSGVDNQLEKLKRFDKAMEGAGHDAMHFRPASFYQVDLYVLTPANNNTKAGASFKAPWPFTIHAADLACESAAGTTGLVDLKVAGTSILDAPQDVKTGAGVGQRVAPEDGSEDVAYDAAVNIVQTSGSAADMIGGQAHLYCQRL